MAGNETAQLAHDLLLAHKPEDVAHDTAACLLCPADIATANKEVASVADVTYTEEQHVALVTAAVQRETADLSKANEDLKSENADLVKRADVAEAEKATAESERDTATKELADFRADVDKEKEIAARTEERVAAVKAANENLPEDYFTDDRATNWAAMEQATFDDFVEAIKVSPAPTAAPQTAAFGGGETPQPKPETPASTAFLAARRGA